MNELDGAGKALFTLVFWGNQGNRRGLPQSVPERQWMTDSGWKEGVCLVTPWPGAKRSEEKTYPDVLEFFNR